CLLALVPIIIGCASAPPAISLEESLASAKCASNEFRSFGAGASEAEALSIARSALARQIHSSVAVFEKYMQSQIVSGDSEHLSSEYVSKTAVESMLSNAHDAHVLRVEHRANETGMVICMSRVDAAKGFAERQRLVADSLELVSRTLPSIKHPKQKNEAWHRTQTLWNEFMRLQGILDDFGVTRAELFSSVSEMHSKTREDYKNYCREQKVYWIDSENEYSNVVFAELSKKITMEKSVCLTGLNLRFGSSDKCASSAMGMECSFEPSLSIESCDGELYSLLKSKGRVAGYDTHNRSKAKENLIAKLPYAAFFKEWETEIKGWLPRCIE
ncbi:MAG: hypothetical protein FWC15_03760, partial [Fibromonadales bacterium]|nr:hypothetical protein [Fibromonadales bacterium]